MFAFATQVRVGDYVAVDSQDETGDWFCHIRELFEDDVVRHLFLFPNCKQTESAGTAEIQYISE